MIIEFYRLRELLLKFKRADESGRKILLEILTLIVQGLPEQVQDPELASETYKRLAFVATMISYLDALHRIENQGFFDILVDFKMPAVFAEPDFMVLQDYFAFHKTNAQMRLKKPLSEIPMEIWQLFREAQKAQLALKGLSHQFHLDELDLYNLPQDQLYPLPIQMMARYVNQSVDRINAHLPGKYRFVQRSDGYLLPGGGMVEADMDIKFENLLGKMLDEHLEEEHANLWLKAKIDYDQVESHEFVETLRHCIDRYTTLDALLGDGSLRNQLNDILSSHKMNSTILSELISLLSKLKLSSDLNQEAEQLKLVRELKASMQVEPFKLTEVYKEAYKFLKSNSECMKIEQFGDTRVAGGKQISNSFLMIGEPLETWFNKKFPGYDCELGDDLTGSQFVELTLLQALAQFHEVKYSHILIVLAHQLLSLEHNPLIFEEIWSDIDYKKARQALRNRIHNFQSSYN